MSGESPVVAYHLGVALAIGLLIGVERGWKERGAAEGQRIAGVRTYGLIGLLGGGLALLAEYLGPLSFALGFVALAVTLAAAYVVNLRHGKEDLSITGLVAGLLTFVLAALAAFGEVALAASSAVVTTLLLSYKPVLHRWVSSLEERELRAGLKLLLISVVFLPILPDRGYGPWQALNPYAIWWMVVLIAALSFLGYVAMKIGGPGRGIAFTGLTTGLVSSTALTLHFARAARGNPGLRPMLAAGTLLACGTMFPRMLLIAGVLKTDLLRPLLLPVAIMTLLCIAPASWYWSSRSHRPVDGDSPVGNPLELKAAVTFGLLLAVVMLLGRGLEGRFGGTGVLALAAASGIADVDAITLSVAHMSETTLGIRTAALAIVVAGGVNSLAKAAMAAAVGGREVAMRVSLPLLGTAAAGMLAGWLTL